MCLSRGGVGGVDERIGFRFYQSCGNRRNVGRVSVFWLCWCRWGVGRVLGPGSEGGGGGYVSVQVQVSVYCAWRIPAHLRCTQCSILSHLMDICFLTCILADITNPDSIV